MPVILAMEPAELGFWSVKEPDETRKAQVWLRNGKRLLGRAVGGGLVMTKGPQCASSGLRDAGAIPAQPGTAGSGPATSLCRRLGFLLFIFLFVCLGFFILF